MDFRAHKTPGDVPLVTVGILSYNYAPYIEETLNSVFNQTYSNIELIIVDDCSADNSLDIINQWIDMHKVECRLIVHETNMGVCATSNKIVELSNGRYIAFFASDDIMNRERIERQVNEMEKLPDDYAFCYSDAEVINERGEFRGLYSTIHKLGALHEGNIFYKFFVQGFRFPVPTSLFRRLVFDKIGLFNEKLTTEDYDIFLRILLYFKVKLCSYTGIQYRVKEKKQLSRGRTRELNEYYHRDRILIYLPVYKSVSKEIEPSDIKNLLVKKINFHLIQLCILKSGFFYSSVIYLLGNTFLKILFGRILILQFKKISHPAAFAE